MKRFAFLAAALLPFALAGIAQAYTVIWPAFPTRTITYQCGVPALAEAVRLWAAETEIEDGGCSTGSVNIQFRVVDPWLNPNSSGQARRLSASTCIVEVKPNHGYPEIVIMLHEVGHCLGLGHSLPSGAPVHGDPGPLGAIMHWNPCNKTPGAALPPGGTCNSMNEDDRAGINYLYGPRPSTSTATPTQATPTATATIPTATQTAQPTATATPTRASTTPTQPSPGFTAVPTSTPTPTTTPVRYRITVGGLAK